MARSIFPRALALGSLPSSSGVRLSPSIGHESGHAGTSDKCQKPTHAVQQDFLFNQLIGELLKLKRYLKPQRLRGLEVDYQLEFGRRLHGKLPRLGTL
jgi:hypothetical protein